MHSVNLYRPEDEEVVTHVGNAQHVMSSCHSAPSMGPVGVIEESEGAIGVIDSETASHRGEVSRE